MKSLIHKFQKLSQKSLIKNSFWQLLAKVTNIICQAVYFTIIVRVLGTENYGLFVGVTSLAALVFPFASLGAGDILIQEVSRSKLDFTFYWGNGLLIVIVASFLLTLIGYLVSPFIFQENLDFLAIFAILLADLTCLSVFILSAKAFVSHTLLKNSSLIQIINTVLKFLAAIIFATCITQPSLRNWSYLYLCTAIITAFIGIFWVNKRLGKPNIILPEIKPMIKEGIYFSLGESAYNINSNIDKTMLASMASLQATGIYGAAYRLVEVASVPVYAVISASYPKFFQLGATGIKSCFGLVKKLLPFALIYSSLALIGFLVFAPWITYLLGTEYQNAIAAVRWLAPITFIGSFQLLLADTLTGAGFQKTRTAIQITTALTNIGLNIWLIPLYSWRGAAWATLGSDSLRVLCLAIAVWVFVRQQAHNSSCKNY